MIVKLLIAASGLGFFLYVVLAGGAQLLSAEVLGLIFAISAVLMPAVAEFARHRLPPNFEPSQGIVLRYNRFTMISWSLLALLFGLIMFYGALHPDKMSEEAIGNATATVPFWGISVFLAVMSLGFGAFGIWQGFLRRAVVRIDYDGIQVLAKHGSHGMSSSGVGAHVDWKDIIAIDIVEVLGTDGKVVSVRCSSASPDLVLCPHVTNLTAEAMALLIKRAKDTYAIKGAR